MQLDQLQRREFITLLGGAAAAWPLAARAQQRAMPVVGFLASSSADAPSGPVAAIHLALKQAGYEVGQTVRMEYRYANNRLARLPALADELVEIPAAVIITSGGPGPTLAAKAATTTIPIVFAPVPDPVRSGLVASFNRPGGNITGVAALTIELDPKRLELLHELPSYGPNLFDSYRQVGLFAARILRGEKPADLPVQQPTKFEFVINLRTAKALGLTVRSR